jgi:exopolysaccharide biosynthesis protein
MQNLFRAILLFITATSANASIVTNAWTPIFKGIDHTRGNEVTADNCYFNVNALRIDLHDPDVQMFTDPPCTNCPFGYETLGLTTSGFLKAYGVQAAVNANFSSPCCSATNGTPMDVIGLSISKGRVVSHQEMALDSSNVMFTTNKQVIMISTNWNPATSMPIRNNTGIYTAVSGHYPLVTNGVNFAYNYTNDTIDPYIHLRQPRTAVGVSQDGRYLYLVTIDGRQFGCEGALDGETGDWLLRFGAYNGINLDGGGSVTMVMGDCAGNPIQLNVPIDQGITRHERVLGNHLGVFAKPLPSFITQLAAAPLDTVATITWTTDSNADSQVEYGLTTSYGSFSYFDPTPVTNHVITLSGLAPNANYFFRAISSAGATPAKADCYFSTSSASLQKPVFDVTQGWKWRTNNLNGIKWQAPNYDDSAWAGPSPGLLYVEDNLAVSPRNTPLPPNNGVPVPGVFVSLTYYFRTHFNFDNAAAVTALIFTNFVDDGAVFYLNGREIYRLRMPPPPAVITFTNYATGSPCLGDATCPDVFSISGGLLTNLVSGDNVLAAELHQYGVYDAVFGSALSYQTRTVFTPTLKIVPSVNTATNTAVISWNATGFTLQQSLSPAGSWFDVPGPVTNTPYATPILSPASFYRLRSQ